MRSYYRAGWSVLREAGASVLAYEVYPLGLATASLPVVPPLWQTAAKPDVPILFLHGLLHNTSTFAWIKQKLTLAGWHRFHALNLSTTQHTIAQMSEQVLEAIEKARADFGVRQVDIVAHSMGGILARYAIQVLGAGPSVRTLITLGTPHQGTELSRYSWIRNLKELAPESETIRALQSAPALTGTQACAVSGSLDVLLRPSQSAYWKGVRNIRLRGVGHAGLLFSNRVVQIISAHLNPPLPAPVPRSNLQAV